MNSLLKKIPVLLFSFALLQPIFSVAYDGEPVTSKGSLVVRTLFAPDPWDNIGIKYYRGYDILDSSGKRVVLKVKPSFDAPGVVYLDPGFYVVEGVFAGEQKKRVAVEITESKILEVR